MFLLHIAFTLPFAWLAMVVGLVHRVYRGAHLEAAEADVQRACQRAETVVATSFFAIDWRSHPDEFIHEWYHDKLERLPLERWIECRNLLMELGEKAEAVCQQHKKLDTLKNGTSRTFGRCARLVEGYDRLHRDTEEVVHGLSRLELKLSSLYATQCGEALNALSGRLRACHRELKAYGARFRGLESLSGRRHHLVERSKQLRRELNSHPDVPGLLGLLNKVEQLEQNTSDFQMMLAQVGETRRRLSLVPLELRDVKERAYQRLAEMQGVDARLLCEAWEAICLTADEALCLTARYDDISVLLGELEDVKRGIFLLSDRMNFPEPVEASAA